MDMLNGFTMKLIQHHDSRFRRFGSEILSIILQKIVICYQLVVCYQLANLPI